MTDHYADARTKNRASTRALMKRSGYADGGAVDLDSISAMDYSPDNVHGFSSIDDSAPKNPPRPTPRPRQATDAGMARDGGQSPFDPITGQKYGSAINADIDRAKRSKK